jgi:hypothetical protein
MRLPGRGKKSEQPLESLDKHSACHAEGRGFEPRRSRHCFQCVSARQLKSVTLISTLELRDEFIAVLFNGHDEALAVPADSVRKVSTRQVDQVPGGRSPR